jgi:hypothetical protein
MYFIGETNERGVYYFYSKQQRGWITADLDRRRADLYTKIALVSLGGLNMVKIVEAKIDLDRAAIGAGNGKWLIDYDDLVPLIRDYGETIDILTVNDEDGGITLYGEAERVAAKAVRKLRQSIDKEGRKKKGGGR